jgi:hypothetical protein
MPLNGMRDMAGDLIIHDLPVSVLHSDCPGMIVYRDEYQMVAETSKRC